MTERWLPVLPDWVGFYEVSDRGRVRSVDRIVMRSDGRKVPTSGQILRQYQDHLGLRSVVLRRPGHCQHVYVHRLVRDLFGDESQKAA
jgi:hypothetical protein